MMTIWKFEKILNRPKSIEEIYMNELNQKNDWNDLSEHFELSEEFLELFKNKVNWKLVTENRHITSEIINKFADYLNWNYISRYWNLNNPEFLKEYSYYINWNIYFKNNKLPENFIIDI